ncbi:DUF4238 domain-containing protein [Kitasatospora sp. NPDC058162]|uniref:DUF4238 domain-containing protein n=1 Tax=Kitasatospora sp. NPDC058162 TaxID=3346362 RepID=UPI0036DA4D2C
MSSPKRHHFVPRAYLARFGDGTQVRVRRRGGRAPYLTNPINVAVQSGFYTTTDVDGVTSTAVEDALAGLDGAGVEAMREIARTDEPPAAGSPGREMLCWYLAVQMARTPRARAISLFPEAVTKYAKGRTLDRAVVQEYLRREHLGFDPEASEIDGAWAYLHGTLAMNGGEPATQTDAIRAALGPIDRYVPYLRARHWRLEVCRKPCFLTSDAPLVLWKRPSPQDAYLGFGLADAEEIRFPLDPSRQLVLVPGTGASVQEVKLARAAQCNADLASACEQVIVGHPQRSGWQDRVELRQRGPVLRFNHGPVTSTGGDGRDEERSLIHLWTTRG